MSSMLQKELSPGDPLHMNLVNQLLKVGLDRITGSSGLIGRISGMFGKASRIIRPDIRQEKPDPAQS